MAASRMRYGFSRLLRSLCVIPTVLQPATSSYLTSTTRERARSLRRPPATAATRIFSSLGSSKALVLGPTACFADSSRPAKSRCAESSRAGPSSVDPAAGPRLEAEGSQGCARSVSTVSLLHQQTRLHADHERRQHRQAQPQQLRRRGAAREPRRGAQLAMSGPRSRPPLDIKRPSTCTPLSCVATAPDPSLPSPGRRAGVPLLAREVVLPLPPCLGHRGCSPSRCCPDALYQGLTVCAARLVPPRAGRDEVLPPASASPPLEGAKERLEPLGAEITPYELDHVNTCERIVTWPGSSESRRRSPPSPPSPPRVSLARASSRICEERKELTRACGCRCKGRLRLQAGASRPSSSSPLFVERTR